jgi:hypothetical protein
MSTSGTTEIDFRQVLGELLEALVITLTSLAFDDALRNMRPCSELAIRSEPHEKYRRDLCHEIFAHARDINPATVTLVEKFGDIIASEFLSIETSEEFLHKV